MILQSIIIKSDKNHINPDINEITSFSIRDSCPIDSNINEVFNRSTFIRDYRWIDSLCLYHVGLDGVSLKVPNKTILFVDERKVHIPNAYRGFFIISLIRDSILSLEAFHYLEIKFLLDTFLNEQ